MTLWSRMRKRHATQSTADVSEREERSQAILEEIPVLICRFLPDGEITFVNGAYCEYFGKTHEELVGARFLSLIPETEREAVMAGISALTAESPVRSQEHQVLAPNGEIRWQRWTNRALFDAGGAIVSYQSVGEDITDRKQAEQEATGERERAQTYLDLAGVMFVSIDVTGTVTLVNPKTCEVLGYTEEEIVGTAWFERFLPERLREPVKQVSKQLLRGEIAPVEYFENPVLTRSGEERLIAWHNTLLLDSEGAIIGHLSSGEDITERRMAEEALSKSETRFRELADLLPEAVFETDPNLNLTYANKRVFELLGYSAEDLSTGLNGFDLVAPGERERARENIARWIQGDTVGLVEYQIVKKDGGTLPMLCHLKPSVSEGEVTGFRGIVIDITRRKQAEMEKRALERQLQHAQKLESLGVLAGGIAHDFNNLLMTILGNADLALDELSPMSPARQNIQEIERASKRAAELAQQMLAYSGKGQFVVEPIDAGLLVEEMAHLLEVSISKKADLKYNFLENLPTFDGDVTQIRQVIMNLITNASEALGEERGVIALSTGVMDCDRAYLDGANDFVAASIEEPLPEGCYVYLEVTDTGCGMDAQTIERIFDPFFTTKFAGRGLGMSAVLGIVRGHKGALQIRSKVGKGTTFKVLLPANDRIADGVAIRGDPEVKDRNWRGNGTVLIVDDEETVCAVGKQMLERLGFDVLDASDGREALRMFREHAQEIACVLLDLTMPQMDGEEAFREIRNIDPNVPIVLCSGYSEQEATQRFADKGLAGFIQKPFSMAALREKLTKVLGSEGA
ncbi:MAG: PAS domain S-box protein [Deltaproteobacteria bacterium]|nr:PAS domain S-box protein [Deltaproteobacteria bacterium]MBW2725283.1 PAS domain S-box protein [Deltaproteobacteria bacterium]